MERVTAKEGRWVASGLYAVPDVVILFAFGLEGVVWSVFVGVMVAIILSLPGLRRKMLLLALATVLFGMMPSVAWEFVADAFTFLARTGRPHLLADVAVLEAYLPIFGMRVVYFWLLTGVLIVVPKIWPSADRP